MVQADIGDIRLKGLALHQAVDMVNYILRLTAEKTRSDVVQIALVENQSHRPDDLAIPYISTRSGYSWFRLDYNGQGLGLIVEPGEKIVVTGHSLGGHLAALATRLFPWLVSDAYTYNAPGFDPSTAELLGLALQGLLNPLGAVILARTDQLTDEYISLLEQSGAIPTPASSFAAVAANIHAIVSEDIVPGDDTSIVSSSFITGIQPAPRQYLAVERDSHDMGQVTDSLRLHAILATLDPTLTFEDIATLYLAISNSVGDRPVVQLRRRGDDTAFSAGGGSGPDPAVPPGGGHGSPVPGGSGRHCEPARKPRVPWHCGRPATGGGHARVAAGRSGVCGAPWGMVGGGMRAQPPGTGRGASVSLARALPTRPPAYRARIQLTRRRVSPSVMATALGGMAMPLTLPRQWLL